MSSYFSAHYPQLDWPMLKTPFALFAIHLEEDAFVELAQLQTLSPSFSLKNWEGAAVKYPVMIGMVFCPAWVL